MFLCKLLGHKMVMKKTVTVLWFECLRCGKHGWVGKRHQWVNVPPPSGLPMVTSSGPVKSRRSK